MSSVVLDKEAAREFDQLDGLLSHIVNGAELSIIPQKEMKHKAFTRIRRFLIESKQYSMKLIAPTQSCYVSFAHCNFAFNAVLRNAVLCTAVSRVSGPVIPSTASPQPHISLGSYSNHSSNASSPMVQVSPRSSMSGFGFPRTSTSAKLKAEWGWAISVVIAALLLIK
ncbi:hypothetical protein ACFE04_013286 [Oxalis oulophora]